MVAVTRIFRDVGSLVFLLMLPLLAALPSNAMEPGWYLLSRDDGCVELRLLVRAEDLPRPPDSPEDFARMLRDRGEQAVVGPMPDSPPELIGKVVQVRFGSGKAPLFVRKEVCSTIDRKK